MSVRARACVRACLCAYVYTRAGEGDWLQGVVWSRPGTGREGVGCVNTLLPETAWRVVERRRPAVCDRAPGERHVHLLGDE